jgi:MYXO-CTERM domain-containing protein
VERLVVAIAALGACTSSHTSSTQQASVIQLESPYAFPDTAIGTQSAPYTIVVSPASGDQLDSVTSISLSCTSSAFTLAGVPALPATVSSMCDSYSYGACSDWEITTQSFQVYFAPTIPTEQSCTVYVTLDNAPANSTCDAGQHQCVTLSGLGVVPAVALSAPAALDFGSIPINAPSAPLPLQVVNNGSDASGAHVTSATAAPAQFAVTMGSDTIPYHGGSDTYGVTCTPTAVGAIGGGMFTLNVAQLQSPLNVPLVCTGVDTNLLFFDNPTTFVGNQVGQCVRVGDHVDVAVELENAPTADTTMSLEGVSVSGSDAGDTELALAPGAANPAGVMLPPGMMTNTTLRYAPTAPTNNDIAQMMTIGQVTVTHDMMSDTLNLNGCAVGASMSVLPADSIDFGPVCIGTSPVQNLQIVMADHGTFAVTSVTAPPAPFAVGGVLPTSTQPVAIDGVTSFEPITVTVTPTDVGPVAGSFAIATDISTGSGNLTRTVALQVTGLPTGVSATPASVDFGGIGVGDTSPVQTLTISNCGSTPVTLGAATITGTDPSAFLIVIPSTSTTIAPNGSVSFGLVLQPKHIGANAATFKLVASSGTVSVPLVGTGANGMGITFNGATYYTCSAGSSPASGWLALALLVAVRRRRRR